jgi:hypothetical protein
MYRVVISGNLRIHGLIRNFKNATEAATNRDGPFLAHRVISQRRTISVAFRGEADIEPDL